MRRRNFIAGLGASAALAPKIAQGDAAVSKRLVDLVRAHNTPGAAVAIVTDKSVWSAAAGRTVGPLDRAVKVNDRFLLGSVGKTYTAALIVEQASQGVVRLDAPIATWLGETGWLSRVANGRRLTLSHLLSHQSGLADHVKDPRFVARVAAAPRSAIPPEALLSYVIDQPPLFEPGEGFAYSDTGYILAGLTLEAASERPYEELLEARLLQPLGLRNTSPANRLGLPGVISGRADPAAGLPGEVNPATEWAGGGVASDVCDLARWCHSLLTGVAMPADYLSTMLMDDQAPAEGRFGLGVFKKTTPLGVAYGHGGWFPGYRALMLHLPEPKLSIAIAINTSDPNDLSNWAFKLLEPFGLRPQAS